MGQVCSGDFLETDDIFSAEVPYMPYKGRFILVIIIIIYAMIGLFLLSIFMLAMTLKYQEN